MTTFAEMKTEMADRGFHHISAARVGDWLNDAYAELCEAQDWPFVEATTTGTAPLTVTYLRQILYVLDTTNDSVLTGTDQRTVQDIDPDLRATGNPERFYLTGSTTVAVWPPNTSASLSVRYLRFPAELSADADEPIVPSRFQTLIVDGAVIRAYRNGDDHERANALRAQWDDAVARMASSLLSRDRHGPATILNTAPLGARNV